MSEQKASPVIKGALAAPILYFDAAPTLGVANAIIEVDLSARFLNLYKDGKVVGDSVCIAHLRCGIDAAVSLRQALDKALKIAGYEGHGPKTPAASDYPAEDDDPAPGDAFAERVRNLSS